MLVLLLLVLLVSVILFIAIPFAIVGYASKHQLTLDYKKWLRIVWAFLKKRSDTKVFLAFMSIEAGLAGILPQVYLLRFETQYFNLWFEKGGNADWISFVIAVIIAYFYYLYLRRNSVYTPERWDEVVDASRIINEEFRFEPTPKWFKQQNDKAITELGTRYSKERNFPFDKMQWLLASLKDSEGFKCLLREELSAFAEEAQSYTLINRKDDNQDIKEVVGSKVDDVIACVKELGADVTVYQNLRDRLDELKRTMYDFVGRENGYAFRSLRTQAEKLYAALSTPWIDMNSKKVWLMVGEAGTGKSHLLGDVVTKRKEQGEPTILLLGEQFTSANDPLMQIKAKLDVNVRKENFLQQLNDYGCGLQKPIVIIIDGLNEGAGELFWKVHLVGLISDIANYEYLRLIVSFRISGRHNWFYDLATNQGQYAVYRHRGFEGREHEACNYIFGSFGLELPSWPVYGKGFANPLFLVKYCKNHEGNKEKLELEDFWTTINKYCRDINHELALANHFDDSLDVVTNSMKSIAKLMVDRTGRWHLTYSDAIAELARVAEYTNNPKGFLGVMIDEGLLRTDSFEGETYVNYGFDRIGDYFIADCLCTLDRMDELDNYTYSYDMGEALAVIVPQRMDKELFEVIKDKRRGLRSFLNSSEWRNSFTAQGKKVLTALREKEDWMELLEVIAKRPFRNDNTANSDTLYEMLWPLSMKERDAIWTVAISEEWGIGRQFKDLADWGVQASESTLLRLDENCARLCTEAIVWILTSTWRQLRDVATHALVNILSVRHELILPIVEKYYKANDPYIVERLWAAVMGAIVCSQDIDLAENIAQWIYQRCFEKRNVPLNILSRDYMKGIIRYAQSLNAGLDLDEKLLSLPLSDECVPEYIMSGDEINARYSVDWDRVKDSEDERDLYIANDRILDSMKTEHSTRGMYGDFGRYIFEAYISGFPVNPEEMSNWAIQMIYEEFGYEAKLFAKFDVNHENYDRSRNNIERIGKKYQWIAMYRILAILNDVNPDLTFEDCWSTPLLCARNIDPTYRIVDPHLQKGVNRYNVPLYDISSPKGDVKWMKAWKEMPDIKEYLLVVDNDGVEWVNLFSYNSIKKLPDIVGDTNTQRLLWTFIQAFVVKKEYINTICNSIHKYGLEGRGFRENREVDGIYAREFFWSDEYITSVRNDHYGFESYELGNMEREDIKIAPAYLIYSHSSSEDASKESSEEILLPNEWLYNGLSLHYAKQNGAWVDKDGRIVIFDNKVYGMGHSALLVRKDVLMDYLNRAGLVMFWPVLTERQIYIKHGNFAHREQNGGWAYMNEKGVIQHKFRRYVLSRSRKVLNIVRGKWMKIWIPLKYKSIRVLYEHGLLKISRERMWQLLGYDTGLPRVYINGVLDQRYENNRDFDRLLEICSQWDEEDGDSDDCIHINIVSRPEDIDDETDNR